MKTTIQQEIERQEKELKNYRPNGSGYRTISYLIQVLESLLEPEKEQIVNAYNTGRSDSRSENSEENDRTAATYFAQRFGA